MATGGLANSGYHTRRGLVPQRPGRQNFGPRQNKGRNGTSQHTITNPQIQAMQGSGNREEPVDIHKNQRMVAGFMHMIGCGVKVTVTNGSIYEGILSSISKEGNLELQHVTLVPQDGYVGNRESIPSMFFQRNHYITFCANNLDLRADSFTDGAIRANGQSAEGREMRALVAWDDGSDGTGMYLEDADSSNGWDAEQMFEENKVRFNVRTTYQDDLADYTVPMPTFPTKQEQMEAERRAAEQAREIESSEGYRERINVENNPEVDEESKFSSVHRPQSESASSTQSGKYVHPNRLPPPQQQQHQDSQGSHMQRGSGLVPPMPSHQPLPQRERRLDRDRGERGHDGRGERDRGWERNPPSRAHHGPGPQQQGPPVPSQPKDNHLDRSNSDRRMDPSGRGGFGPRPVRLGGPQGPPNPHHGGPQGAHGQHGMPPSVSAHGHPNHVPNLTANQHLAQGGHNQHGAPQGGPASHHPMPGVPGQPHLTVHKQHHQGLVQGAPPSQHHAPHPHAGPTPHHPPQPVVQMPPSQHTGGALSAPSHPHPNPSFPVAPAVSSHPQQGPPQIPPPVSVPSSAPQGPINRAIPPVSAAVPPVSVVGASQTVASSPPMDRPEVQTLSPHTQHPQAAGVYSGADKKSREKDTRQEQQVAKLRQFQKNFNLAEESAESHSQQPDRQPDTRDQGQSTDDTPQVTPAQSGPPASQPASIPTSSQASAAQPQSSQSSSSTPATTVGEPTGVVSSTLNPLASEFRPRQQQQPPQPTVMQVASPAPSATPPSQGLRQSPGMMSHQVLPYHLVQSKMVPMSTNPPQPHTKPYQPKRAVVSVDPVQLAHSATGQPLTLGAQGPTMQQPSYVYMPTSNVLPQAGPYPQVRVMPSIAHQGASMDHSQGVSSQQHVAQPFIMAHQQPVPAHMPAAQALTQNIPQPAHTMNQHLSQSHPTTLPPISQNQSGNPLPSASPVQHMGLNGHSHVPGAPSINHSQGAPPTSGAPQSQMAYGHQMPGLLPPQGVGPHAVPAHSVAQAPNPTMQYLHHQHQHPHQHQLTGGVSFSQAGATVGGGPAPAHVQSSGHVVLMPQPPPQTINQAPIHNQQQHAAQFQQQLQGAASQLHAPMAHNQHLIQGNVPNAGPGGMAIPQHMAFMPQGVQGSHNPHSLGHGHPHSQQHQHGHQPSHSFQGGN